MYERLKRLIRGLRDKERWSKRVMSNHNGERQIVAQKIVIDPNNTRYMLKEGESLKAWLMRICSEELDNLGVIQGELIDFRDTLVERNRLRVIVRNAVVMCHKLRLEVIPSVKKDMLEREVDEVVREIDRVEGVIREKGALLQSKGITTLAAYH